MVLILYGTTCVLNIPWRHSASISRVDMEHAKIDREWLFWKGSITCCIAATHQMSDQYLKSLMITSQRRSSDLVHRTGEIQKAKDSHLSWDLVHGWYCTLPPPKSMHIYIYIYIYRHYNDIIMSAFASQITIVSIVYSNVCSSADQRIHQSSAPLKFVRGIHRWVVRAIRSIGAEGGPGGQRNGQMVISWKSIMPNENRSMHLWNEHTTFWYIKIKINLKPVSSIGMFSDCPFLLCAVHLNRFHLKMKTLRQSFDASHHNVNTYSW